jgi:hypothetical protein
MTQSGMHGRSINDCRSNDCRGYECRRNNCRRYDCRSYETTPGSHSSPIVDHTQDFTCLIVLKDLSFVGHYTGIVSKIQTMVYKSCLLHVVVSSSLWLIIYKSLPDFSTLKPIHKVYFPSQVCLIGIEQSINYFRC